MSEPTAPGSPMGGRISREWQKLGGLTFHVYSIVRNLGEFATGME